MTNKIPKTKQKILETAMSLIWQSSYERVSVDDICAQAEVKKGSFYHYFDSKIALLREAMEYFYSNIQPVFDEIFSSQKTPLIRIKDYCNLAVQMQKELKRQHNRVCGCPFSSIGSEISAEHKDIHTIVSKVFTYKKSLFEQTLKDMQRSGDMIRDEDISGKVEKIYTYIIGTMMMARIQNDISILENHMHTGILEILNIEKIKQ